VKITLLQTGKTTETHVAEGIAIYASRIRKYCNFDIITVPDIRKAGNMPVGEQKTREGARIIEVLGKKDQVVLLDEKGKEFTTTEFARWLEKRLTGSAKRVVFIIGGAWGVPDEVRAVADFSISLSRMTFPHQLVRLLFVEQVYRAFSILKGEPYHHE
jgi:23S rRNA (pseudouridine1915-N3)-methyltransferase